MKRAKKLLGGIAALALAMFLAPGIAQASDYNDNCANIGNFNGSGNVTITDTSCTLPQSITATGYIHITADSVSASGKNLSGNEIDIQTTGNVTIGNLTAANSYVYVAGDDLSVGNVTTTTYGNILLVAQGDLGVGDVSGAAGYNIDLKAHAGGGNSLFTIGSTGSNAVASITAHPGSNSPTYASTVVYVTNGEDAAATGGITVAAANKLVAAATGSYRAGHIFLNAQNGTLTMPSGNFNVDGSGTSTGAGSIALLANTVTFGSSAVLSASQHASVSGTLHGVAIAANTINFSGGSGLEIHADGAGYAQYYNAFVQLMAQGAITISEYGGGPAYLTIYGYSYPYSTSGGTTYTGSSTAPLKVTANGGAHTLVEVAGYPLSFSGGNVTLEAKGSSDHSIKLYNQGTWTGTTGLTFGGSGAVTLNANGDGGAGGDIAIQVDEPSISGTSFTVKADGPASGNGNGGSVYFYTSGLTLNGSTTASISAKGATSGTGNAVFSDPADYQPVAITFIPSANVNFGSGAGKFTLNADGGASGGNAGTIIVYPYPGDISVSSAGAVSASALDGDSNGGWVQFGGYVTSFTNNASCTKPLFDCSKNWLQSLATSL